MLHCSARFKFCIPSGLGFVSRPKHQHSGCPKPKQNHKTKADQKSEGQPLPAAIRSLKVFDQFLCWCCRHGCLPNSSLVDHIECNAVVSNGKACRFRQRYWSRSVADVRADVATGRRNEMCAGMGRIVKPCRRNSCRVLAKTRTECSAAAGEVPEPLPERGY